LFCAEFPAAGLRTDPSAITNELAGIAGDFTTIGADQFDAQLVIVHPSTVFSFHYDLRKRDSMVKAWVHEHNFPAAGEQGALGF
jgi:hypothetical protein